ncbi:MAG: mandelate racemase, partial [Candidatus Poribacteria bacterium]|nr:mandelate racemase [Candidatus Poribacteria bacterium]
MADPKITKIEVVVYQHEIHDMGTDYNGFNTVYEKGSVLKMRPSILRIHTDAGIIGESDGGRLSDSVVQYLLGKNPFHREKIYNDLKRGLRHTDRTAISS